MDGQQCLLGGTQEWGLHMRHAVYRTGGVTLIEMMIAIVIMAILTMLALPSFGRWIHNGKIRTATEAIQNGLQLARTEALKRNTSVAFALAPDSSWTVTAVFTGETIQARSGGEGSAGVVLAVAPAGASTVTFNALGRVSPNADGSPTLTQIDVDVPTTVLPANESRNLRITVSPGGQIRMCDPDPGIQTGDPRKC